MESIKINMHVTEEDYLSFNIYHVTKTKEGKKSLRKVRMISMSVALLFAVFALISGIGKDRIVWGAPVAIMLMAALICYLRAPKWYENAVRRALLQSKESGKLPYTEDSEVSFEEDRIVVTHKAGVLLVRHEDITKVCEFGDMICVYFGAMQAILIPRREMGDKEKEIREYLGKFAVE